MAYIIAEPCINVKDKACVEVCPVDCIYEGETMLYIHPDECIDCGACEPVCPVKAIFAEDETPGELEELHRAEQAVLQGQPGRQAGHQGVAGSPRPSPDGARAGIPLLRIPAACSDLSGARPSRRVPGRAGSACGPRRAVPAVHPRAGARA